MKKLLIFFLIFTSCTDNSEFFENSYCIKNINLIDAKKGLQENMTVVISKNQIVKIEKSSNLNLSKKNNIIDGSNNFIVGSGFEVACDINATTFDLDASGAITIDSTASSIALNSTTTTDIQAAGNLTTTESN